MIPFCRCVAPAIKTTADLTSELVKYTVAIYFGSTANMYEISDYMNCESSGQDSVS